MNVICFRWGTKYLGEHVNALARQVREHYARPHRFLCVTNDATDIDRDLVEILPDREDFWRIARGPQGGPGCYRRLILWHPDAAQWFGERFVCIDIDVTVHGDLAPLWDRPEPVVAYRDPFHGGRGQYCGSMLLMTAGTQPEVWNDFAADPRRAIARAAAAGFRGSDQAWISYRAPGLPTWSPADGVYSYRVDVRKNGLPDDAKLVIWHGAIKPWDFDSSRRSAEPRG